jgi:hypothetical protein
MAQLKAIQDGSMYIFDDNLVSRPGAYDRRFGGLAALHPGCSNEAMKAETRPYPAQSDRPGWRLAAERRLGPIIIPPGDVLHPGRQTPRRSAEPDWPENRYDPVLDRTSQR